MGGCFPSHLQRTILSWCSELQLSHLLKGLAPLSSSSLVEFPSVSFLDTFSLSLQSPVAVLFLCPLNSQLPKSGPHISTQLPFPDSHLSSNLLCSWPHLNTDLAQVGGTSCCQDSWPQFSFQKHLMPMSKSSFLRSTGHHSSFLLSHLPLLLLYGHLKDGCPRLDPEPSFSACLLPQ